jgi:hypothetical protein
VYIYVYVHVICYYELRMYFFFFFFCWVHPGHRSGNEYDDNNLYDENLTSGHTQEMDDEMFLRAQNSVTSMKSSSKGQKKKKR